MWSRLGSNQFKDGGGALFAGHQSGTSLGARNSFAQAQRERRGPIDVAVVERHDLSLGVDADDHARPHPPRWRSWAYVVNGVQVTSDPFRMLCEVVRS
ncbi:MAG: hypothetical protein ACXVX4_00730, partial [Mycobacterium sp.]